MRIEQYDTFVVRILAHNEVSDRDQVYHVLD